MPRLAIGAMGPGAAELQQAAAQLALLVGSTKTALATNTHDHLRPARHATSSTGAKKSKSPAPRAPRHDPAPPLAASTPAKLTAEPALSFGE